MTFRLIGLPPSSGLSINQRTGALQGAPNDSDLKAPQPLQLTLRVGGPNGQAVSTSFNLNVVEGNKPPVAMSIPAAQAIQGRRFEVRLGSRFYDPDGDSLLYTIGNLPKGSGFSIDRHSATVSGIPTLADCSVHPQPQKLVIGAHDGHANGNTDAFFFVEVKCANNAPHTKAVPTLRAERGKFFTLDISKYYHDIDGDELGFSLNVPENSGFSLDHHSGVISGVPTNGDCLHSQPLVIEVTADDGKGGVTSLNIPIDVSCGVVVPVGQRIPPLTVYGGLYFERDLSQFFAYDGPYNLTFTMTGLPVNTAVFLSEEGLLAGVPGDAACAAEFLIARILADDGHGGTATSNLFMNVECADTVRPAPTWTRQPTPWNWQPTLISRTRQPTIDPYYTGPPTYPKVVPWTSPLSEDGLEPVLTPTVAPPSVMFVPWPSGPSEVDKLPTVPSRYSQEGIEVFTAHDGLPFSQSFGALFDFPPWALRSVAFSVDGLPEDSALSLDPVAGTLSGIPNNSDCRGSPIGLIVTGDTSYSPPETRHAILQVTCNGNVAGPVIGPISFPIPDQHSADLFFLDLTNYFHYSGTHQLFYSVKGLPSDSGFTVSTDGIITGRPSRADCALSQPISLEAVVNDGYRGHATRSFTLKATNCDLPADGDNNVAPVARIIPSPTARLGKLLFFDVSSFFSDANADVLSYSLAGLPSDSGLQIGTKSGIISGTPTEADLQAAGQGFINLRIIVNDGRGGIVQGSTRLTILPAELEAPEPVITDPFANALIARVDQDFSADLKDRLSDSGDFMSIIVDGLPIGSGLSVDPLTGLLEGRPTTADAAGPIMLLITAYDASGGILQANVPLKVQLASEKYPFPMVPLSNPEEELSEPPKSTEQGAVVPVPPFTRPLDAKGASLSCEDLGWALKPNHLTW